MTCQQDNYYKTDIINNVNGACGSCACSDNHSDSCACSICAHGPEYCPSGQLDTGRFTGCSECVYGGAIIGHRKICRNSEPSMDQPTQINCCLNQNLPGNNPKGYCASGWCPDSQNCISFMTNYCKENKLETAECKQFCRSNKGKCDVSLINYCADSKNFNKPICGCALPTNQYILSNLKTPNGEAIPISCDQRCGVNQDAIRLQGQQDCNIGTICVISVKDIDIVKSQVKTGINIVQNCGNSPAPPIPSSPSSGFFNKIKNFIVTNWIIFVIFIVLIIIMIIIIVVYRTQSRKQTENN